MHRYVLDTNVLVASLSSRSPHHWIWVSLTQQKEFFLLWVKIFPKATEMSLERQKPTKKNCVPYTVRS